MSLTECGLLEAFPVGGGLCLVFVKLEPSAAEPATGPHLLTLLWGRSGQVRSRQVRSGQGRSGQRSVTESAARPLHLLTLLYDMLGQVR